MSGVRERARLPLIGSLIAGALLAMLPALARPLTRATLPNTGLRISGGGTVAQRFPNGAYVRFTMGGVVEGTTSARGVLGGLFVFEEGGKPRSAEGMLSIRCAATRIVGATTQVFMVGTARSFDPDGPNGDAYVYLVDDPKGDRLWSGQMDRMPSTCVVPDEVLTFGMVQRLDRLAQPVTDGDFVVRR
jgi:hypothetical protein